MLGVLAGAGIFNGVTKSLLSTMIIPNSCAAWSALHQDGTWLLYANGAGFCAGSSANSQGLFGNTDYQGLVRLVALGKWGLPGATCYWR